MVIAMTTTISVSRETKKLLESIRGDLTWDELLRSLVLKEKGERERKAVDALRKTSYNRDASFEESRLRLGLR